MGNEGNGAVNGGDGGTGKRFRIASVRAGVNLFTFERFEKTSDHEGLELHGAPLSPAPRNSRWQVEISFGRARELKLELLRHPEMQCEMKYTSATCSCSLSRRPSHFFI